MFAPPPLQLSRAEIQTRLTGEEKTAERKISPKTFLGKSLSLRRHESRSPTSPRRHFFGKGDKVSTSPPVIFGPGWPLPEPQTSAESSNAIKTDVERVAPLPEGFGENPRPAPTPPKRSAAVLAPDVLWTPPLPGAFPPPQDPLPVIPSGNHTPPPIPPKSPRRPSAGTAGHEGSYSLQQSFVLKKNSLRSVVSAEGVNNDIATASKKFHPWPHRASTSSAMINRKPVNATGSGMPGRARSSPWTSYEGGDSVQKFSQRFGTNSKQLGATSTRVNKSFTGKRQRLERPHVNAGIPSSGRGHRQLLALNPSNRIGLLQNGDNLCDCNSAQGPQMGDALYRQDFVDKALPDTPRSIVLTPTEMYQNARTSPSPRSQSRSSPTRMRSPLAQIPATNAKANSSILGEERISPSRLSAIPEHTASDDKLLFASGSGTAVTTRIHLRNGSLVTVSPPELTAWQLTIYTQGPIKLPKPVIVPRKNSVASLEPFQEAIDQVYQDALTISRRRSDDKVLDDICEFFDEFGFEENSFECDNLGQEEMEVDETMEIDFENDLERFSTPPVEPVASPVEKRVAQDIVGTMTSQLSLSDWQIQPTGNEEALRTKAIAGHANRGATQPSILMQYRRDSMTLSKFDSGVSPLLTLPKVCIAEEVLGHFRYDGTLTSSSRYLKERGIDRDNDVQELDALSSWVAPAAAMPRTGFHRTPSMR